MFVGSAEGCNAQQNDERNDKNPISPLCQSELPREGFGKDFANDKKSKNADQEFTDPIGIEVCAIVCMASADGNKHAGTQSFRQQVCPEDSIFPPAPAQEHRYGDREFQKSGKNPENILQGPMHEFVTPYIGPRKKIKECLSDEALRLIRWAQRNGIASISK